MNFPQNITSPPPTPPRKRTNLQLHHRHKQLFYPISVQPHTRFNVSFRQQTSKYDTAHPTSSTSALHIHKDRHPHHKKAGVYRIPCECSKVYIGETGRNLETRLKEHKTSYRLSDWDKSAIVKHAQQHEHVIQWDNSKLITTINHWNTRRIREAIEIHRHNTVPQDLGLYISDIWKPLINKDTDRPPTQPTPPPQPPTHHPPRHQPSLTSATRKPSDSSIRHSQRHRHSHPHITRRHQPSLTSATREPRDSSAANVGSTHSAPPTPHPRTPSTPPASASRTLKAASESPFLRTIPSYHQPSPYNNYTGAVVLIRTTSSERIPTVLSRTTQQSFLGLPQSFLGLS